MYQAAKSGKYLWLRQNRRFKRCNAHFYFFVATFSDSQSVSH